MPPSGVSLISVPYHAGLPAVAMGNGPSALLGRHNIGRALGEDVSVEVVDPPDAGSPEIARTFAVARGVAARVRAAVAAGRMPLVLAGNCNSCLGTVAGIEGERLGVVWFDAHADFDTPEDNVSGFMDVMALSTLTGACWQTQRRSIEGFREVAEQDVVLVGARDLEDYQRERLERSSIRTVRAIADGLADALDALRERVDRVYLHLDLDVLDPSEGCVNQYSSPDGLSFEELESALRLVGDRFTIAAAAITAYDPAYDTSDQAGAAAVKAARIVWEVAG